MGASTKARVRYCVDDQFRADLIALVETLDCERPRPDGVIRGLIGLLRGGIRERDLDPVSGRLTLVDAARFVFLFRSMVDRNWLVEAIEDVHGFRILTLGGAAKRGSAVSPETLIELAADAVVQRNAGDLVLIRGRAQIRIHDPACESLFQYLATARTVRSAARFIDRSARVSAGDRVVRAMVEGKLVEVR